MTCPTTNITRNASVHIPLCGDTLCQFRLKQLATSLREKGLVCVTDYKLTGRYSRWFKEAFHETSITILHQCPTLWKKIHSSQKLLAQESKVIAVDVYSEASILPQELGDGMHKDFIAYFEDLTIHDLEPEDNVEPFSKRVISFLEENVHEYGASEQETSSLSNDGPTCQEQVQIKVLDHSSGSRPIQGEFDSERENVACPTTNLTRNAAVHIPLCQNSQCRVGVKRLATTLREKGLTCVTDYKLTGRYSRWFKEAFHETSITILHRCPKLWKKIHSCQKLLARESKVITVAFTTDVSWQLQKLEEGMCKDFMAYFEDQMIHNVAAEDSVEPFSERVISFVEENIHEYDASDQETSSLSNDTYQKQDETNVLVTSIGSRPIQEEIFDSEREEEDEMDSEEDFEVYPDIFSERKPEIFVRKSCLEHSDISHLPYSSTDECLKLKSQIDENKDKVSAVQMMSNFKYILYQVLPTMYKQTNVVGLTIMASSSLHIIQERSLIYLELILLEKRGVHDNLDYSTLQDMEISLTVVITDLGKKFKISGEAEVLLVIQRVSALYLMLLCEIIITSKDGPEMHKCDILLRTVEGRPFAASKHRNQGDEHLSHVDSFVRSVCSKTCKVVRSAVGRYMKFDNPVNQAKKLLTKSLSSQIIVIFDLMKKIFKDFDTKAVDFLEEYVKVSKGRCKTTAAPVVCLSLLFRSLALFLTYGLRRDTNQDIQQLCSKACKVLGVIERERDLPLQVESLMQTLLFNKESVISRGMRKLIHEVNRLTIDSYLLDEVERTLCPLLIIDETRKYHTIKLHSEWKKLSGHFDCKSVLIVVYIPKDGALKGIQDKQSAQEDCCHIEMRRLLHLQHKNIVRLFAYQKTAIPQFYVVDDYLQDNLQMALKNRSNRGAFFTIFQLYYFLMEASSAIEYCHSKGYVLRNLTAASLCLISGNNIKLCGFHMCLRLVPGEEQAMEKNSPGIPTRWSAPESLEGDIYTKASDVWMVGHLLFEVLTHGLLPYSHIRKPEDEIVRLIILNQASLFQEPCIEQRAFDVIIQCTQKHPDQRPSVSEIKCKLEEFHGTTKEHMKTPFPQLTSATGKPSTDYKLGIPSYVRSQLNNSNDNGQYGRCNTVSLSETLLRFERDDQYIFREKIRRKLPNELLVKLSSGALKDILPAIKVNQNDSESQHIECSVPLSCLGNLLELTLKRNFGNLTGPYIYCLYKMAVVLENLYKHSWIIGDICASNIYVERTDDTFKVHVVSLAYLRTKDPNQITSDDPTTRPKDLVIVSRMAPEVLSHGLYSSASDVFCFGVLIWEVLTAYDHPNDEDNYFARLKADSQRPENSYKVHDQIVVGDWEKMHQRPECCSEGLWELVKLCVHVTYSIRPTVSHVVKILKKYCVEDFGLTFDENDDVPLSSTMDPFVPSDGLSPDRNQSSLDSTSGMGSRSETSSQYATPASVKDQTLLQDSKVSPLAKSQTRNIAASYKSSQYEEIKSNIYEDIDGDSEDILGRSSKHSVNRSLPPIPLQKKSYSFETCV